MKLKLSPDLELPLEAVTQKFAILAKSGGGKTYTASVLTEEMVKARMQVVVVDPTGGWYGLRSSADGKSPGLPVIIAGGEHGDVPLEEGNAKTIADLVIDNKYSMVLDLSNFRKAAQKRFVAAFLDELYHRNRSPIHVVVDEADLFAPQMVRGGEDPHVLGAMEDIVRRGRIKGIGITLITQRPSVLNKDVLTQVDALILLRLVGPQDRKAVDDWVNINADRQQRDELMATLPSLKIGEAWFWAPAWGKFLKTQIRKRETLDSSSTPKLGEKRIEPTATADINLKAIREALAATIEKAEGEDPKALRRRIAELEHERAEEKKHPLIETREVSVLTEDDRRTIGSVLANMDDLGDLLRRVVNTGPAIPTIPPTIMVSRPKGAPPMSPRAREAITEVGRAAVKHMEENPPPVTALGPGERKVLGVVAQYDNGVERTQLTVLTGYKQSSRNTYIQRLSQRGLVTVIGTRVRATDAGITELGDDYEPLPTGPELREHWLGQLPAGEKSILEQLIAAYPSGLSRGDISERTGYLPSSRNTYIQRMSSRGIIEVNGQEIRASDDLFMVTR